MAMCTGTSSALLQALAIMVTNGAKKTSGQGRTASTGSMAVLMMGVGGKTVVLMIGVAGRMMMDVVAGRMMMGVAEKTVVLMMDVAGKMTTLGVEGKMTALTGIRVQAECARVPRYHATASLQQQQYRQELQQRSPHLTPPPPPQHSPLRHPQTLQRPSPLRHPQTHQRRSPLRHPQSHSSSVWRIGGGGSLQLGMGIRGLAPSMGYTTGTGTIGYIRVLIGLNATEVSVMKMAIGMLISSKTAIARDFSRALTCVIKATGMTVVIGTFKDGANHADIKSHSVKECRKCQ